MDTHISPRMAVGYCRVSTDQQEDEGVSLDAQREKIRAWCVLNDHELLEVYSEALSGKEASGRQALQEAIRHCERTGAVLVVYSVSRLTRSTEDGITIDRRLRVSGSRIVSLTEAVDTRTAAGRFVYRVFCSVYEYERENIVERTQLALDYKKTRQEHTGKVPYGFRLALDGKTLEPDAQERETLTLIDRYHREGLSLRAIGSRLAAQSILARGGRPFAPSTLKRIIEAKPSNHAV